MCALMHADMSVRMGACVHVCVCWSSVLTVMVPLTKCVCV